MRSCGISTRKKGITERKIKMDWLKDLGFNYVLIAGATAWIAAQILKCATGVFKLKKFTLLEIGRAHV